MSKGIWEGEKQPRHRDKRQQDRSATIWRQSGGKNHSNQDTSVILPLSLAYFSVPYLVILLKSELAPSCISNGSYFKISYKTHKRRTLLQVADLSTMGSETQSSRPEKTPHELFSFSETGIGEAARVPWDLPHRLTGHLLRTRFRSCQAPLSQGGAQQSPRVKTS